MSEHGTALRTACAAIVISIMAVGGAVAMPTAAATTSFVAGSGMGVQAHVDRAGVVHRQVTVPAEAALLQARTPDAVKQALRADAAQFAAEVAPPSSERWTDAMLVGDLDGDGLRDLLLQKQSWDSARFVAVSGQDNKRLWSYTMDVGADDAWGWGGAWPMQGRDAGILVLTEAYVNEQETDATWSFDTVRTFTALNEDGTVRWRKEYTGSVAGTEFTIVGAGFPMIAGIAPISGPGDDLAVGLYDFSFSETAVGTARIEVIDGANGSVRPIAVAGSVPGEDWPAAGVVGDLDGDKLADIVTVSSAGGEVRAVAHNGTQGTPLWQNTYAGHPVMWVEGAGRTDGDAADDILFQAVDWERWDNFFQTTLASGADGTRRWQRYSEGATVVGDIGGEGRNDVVFTGIVDSGKEWGVSYSAMNGAGRRLYDRAYTVGAANRSMFGMLSIGLDMVGDVDQDGTLDFAHAVSVSAFRPRFHDTDRGVVLAKNGKKAFSGRAAGDALGASVDRRGADLVTVRYVDGKAAITARDGATGSTIWQASVRMDQFRMGYARGGDITGDRRAEVIVIAQMRRSSTIVVLDGASGDVLWRRDSSVVPSGVVTPIEPGR